MNKKSKSTNNTLAELHFVSSLRLEQSVMLVGDIADEHHQVTLTEVSPHEFKFHIDYLPETSKLAEINGTLLRWNGTETKIDADGEIYRMEDSNSSKSTMPAILSSAFLTFVGTGFAISTGASGLALLIIIGGVGMTYYAISSDEDDNPQTIVLFRHRDYLLQRLIDAFKSVGEVEAI